LIKISNGSSSPAPICRSTACTNGSNAWFGRPGFADTISSPGARSATSPDVSLPSHAACGASPLALGAAPLTADSRGERPVPALFTNTANKPDTTAASISASV
jgi:hypothetical protein